MNKRIAALALLLVLCLTLTGCGKFSIVGKWKSVGSYGFGQAQPGAIVVLKRTTATFSAPVILTRFIRTERITGWKPPASYLLLH